MLVLSRKDGESIVLGDCVEVTILAISKRCVRLGISAPDDCRILRAELIERSSTRPTEYRHKSTGRREN